MEILNYDRELSSQDRFRRFSILLDKVYKTIEEQKNEIAEGDQPKKPFEMTGMLVGP